MFLRVPLAAQSAILEQIGIALSATKGSHRSETDRLKQPAFAFAFQRRAQISHVHVLP
jgi:hypothetical protein